MQLKLWSQKPGRGWPGAQGEQSKCRTIQVQKVLLRGFQRDGAKQGGEDYFIAVSAGVR